MKHSIKLSMLLGSILLSLPALSAVSSYNTSIAELNSSISLKIENPLHFNLRSSRDLGEGAHTTLMFNTGTFLGNNEFYIPTYDGAVSKDQITSVLSQLISKPAAGFYCFMNLKPRESLEIQGNSVIQAAVEMKINSCYVKDAVTKVEGNRTTNFSFNMMGKSNEISMHFCTLDNANKDEQSDIAGEIGCISYKSTKVPKVSDFLSALNLRASELQIGDLRADDVIQAEEQLKAEKKQEKARLEAIENKKRDDGVDYLKEHEKRLKEDREFFKTMPKVTDPRYIALAKENPEFEKLHGECAIGTILKKAGAAEACAAFKEMWNKK